MTAGGAIGRSVRDIRAPQLLTGGGRFVDDHRPARCLHAAIVRSTIARGRILDIDASEALRVPGVHAVLTATDLDGVCGSWKGMLGWPGMVCGTQHALAPDEVRHVGEPIAIVLADDRATAEDGAELVLVDIEPLDAVVDAVAAMAPGSPLVHEELGTNVAFHGEVGEGDVEDAFARAAHTVDVDMHTSRHTATAIEPRGIVAEYDPMLRQLTVRVSSQAPHMLQALYARIFGLTEADVRVVTDDVGGSFGMKAIVYPDEAAAIAASIVTGRPVKWMQDRAEALVSDTQARDERVHAEIALDPDGTILGLRCTVVSDGGAYSGYPRGCVTEGFQVMTVMPGPYRVGAYHGELHVVITNKPPLSVYRGVGHPVAILVMETLLDEAARQAGLDPVELRRRNLIRADELPFTTTTGFTYDSGSHHEALERLVTMLDEQDLPARRAAAARRGVVLGVGIACFVELSAPGAMFYGAKGAPITAHDQVAVRIEPDGTVSVLLGTPGQGQGLETAAAQVVAHRLGVDLGNVRVVAGDTATVPHGTGTWASRTAVVSAGAAARAADTLRGRLTDIAAHMLEASADDLSVRDGGVWIAGEDAPVLTVAEVAQRAHWQTHLLPDDTTLSLADVGEYAGPPMTWNNGVHAAIVEVDPQLGTVAVTDYLVVEDCGVMINPALVDGQIRGGVAQGIGGALFEELVLDDAGQPLVGTLMDYLVPTTMDVPDLVIEHIETPSPVSLLGTKGVGEAGTAGAPAAVHNAVNDALRHLGATVWRQPMTPERVLAAIEDAAQHSIVDGRTPSTAGPADGADREESA